MAEIYVRLKDSGGSHYHANMGITLRGVLPSLVDENDSKISLLLSNGALEKVKEEEALAIIKEQEAKNSVALIADNQRKKERIATIRGLRNAVDMKAAATPIETKKPDTSKEKAGEKDTTEDSDPKSDANIELFIEKAIAIGVIEKSGTWYKHDSQVIDQGMDETIIKLQENEELYNKIAALLN